MLPLLPVVAVLGALVPGQYSFVPDTSRWIEAIRGETFSCGKLDAAGDFHVEPYSGEYWINRSLHQGYSAGRPPAQLINGAPGPAYQYRSGRLIRGTLTHQGIFVPQAGSKVITFDTYLRAYEPGKSLRIYNLPGKIVAK